MAAQEALRSAAAETTVSAAARQLGRALLSAAGTCQSWAAPHEEAVHRFLVSHRRHQDGGDGSSPFLTPSLVAATIDPHLLPHQPLALGFFHWASHQPGFSHTAQTYHSVLRSLSTSRRPTAVQSILEQARAKGVALPPSSTYLAAKSLLLCNRTLEAFKLVDGVQARSGISPIDDSAGEVCNSLLAAASDDGHWNLSRKLFDGMTLTGVGFNDVGFGVFIHGICRSSGLGEALRLVDRMKAQAGKVDGSLMAALVVDGLCQAGRMEEAWEALEELRQRGCKPDFVAYRIVSEEFRKAGRMEESLKILKQKRKLGVAPRAGDYREYILRLISERRIHAAKKLGEALAGGDFPIDSGVVNALVGSVSAVDAASALSLCRYMVERRGEFPTLLTLSNLSKNLCKAGKSDELWEMFSALLSKGYFQDADGYGLMVSFLCKAGRVREAYEVLKEMRKRGLKPGVSCYNSLMEACCREELIRPAKKLWDEMFACGCCGDLRTYNILIGKFSEVDDADEALRLFRHMEEKGVIPDETTYKSLVRVLCRASRTDEAREIFEKSRMQDPVALAGFVLSTLVLHLCRDGDFAAASALIRGLPPATGAAQSGGGSSSHVVLLKGFAGAGLLDQAIEHMEWIRDNAPPDLKETVLRELAGSLSTAPNLEAFMRLLQAMRRRGLLPDKGPWADLCHGP